MEEAHVASRNKRTLTGLSANDGVAHATDSDISDLLDQTELVRESRPAKMVTALRIDLDTQSALESAAAARGIGVITLMRRIIEEWVLANSDTPADHISELVRHPRRGALSCQLPRQPRRRIAPERWTSQDPDYTRNDLGESDLDDRYNRR